MDNETTSAIQQRHDVAPYQGHKMVLVLSLQLKKEVKQGVEKPVQIY
jgi:hypothetical protein